MKKILFILFLLCSTVLQAQYSYNRIAVNPEAKKQTYIHKISKKDSICITPGIANGMQKLTMGNYTYRAENRDEKLEYEIFDCPKEHKTFILVNKTNEMSLGCDVYLYEKNNIKHCGYMPIAAYTKDMTGRMNYNNVLPYISIVKVSNRYIFSFETPLIVLYPGQEQEEIVNGRDVYFNYEKKVLQLNR